MFSAGKILAIFSVVTYLFGPSSVFAQDNQFLQRLNTRPLEFRWEILPSYHPKSFGVPILMYHYLSDNPEPNDVIRSRLSVSPEMFADQMNYLVDHGFETITLNTLYGIFNRLEPSPEKPIVLTFDDGYADFYFSVYPVLQKHHFLATEFIPTGFIGRKGYLSWDQIRDMHRSGLVSFQAHTANHVDLRTASDETLAKELLESKNTIESRLSATVNFMAYPYGSVDQRVISAAKNAGFLAGLGTNHGKVNESSYIMPRVRVNGGISLIEFAKIIE